MGHQWLSGQSCSLHTGHALSLSPVAAEKESTAPRLWLGVTQPRPSPASSLLRPEVSAKILGATPPASLTLSLHTGHHTWPVLRPQDPETLPSLLLSPRSSLTSFLLGASGPRLRASASSRATPTVQTEAPSPPSPWLLGTHSLLPKQRAAPMLNGPQRIPEGVWLPLWNFSEGFTASSS